MKNDELDKKSPVETIDVRLKRLCMNEIDARIETKGMFGRSPTPINPEI